MLLNKLGLHSARTVHVNSGFDLTSDSTFDNLTIYASGRIQTHGYKVHVDGTLDLINAQPGAITK